jgi:hypothetical protein
MRALPAALRPNPYAIDEEVMEAMANGWGIHDLAEACYTKDRNPNPAFVVTNLRNLCKHPPTQTKRPGGWEYGHIPCDRHPNCEICRCLPNVMTHHVPSVPHANLMTGEIGEMPDD